MVTPFSPAMRRESNERDEEEGAGATATATAAAADEVGFGTGRAAGGDAGINFRT
jgi:hypothetical protein